jgi:leucyl aminopeptidase (aminopeptidase T)
MYDHRVEKLADILVNYSTAVQPGDWVLVQGDVLALPLVNEVVKHVLRAGGNPTINLVADELQETHCVKPVRNSWSGSRRRIGCRLSKLMYASPFAPRAILVH